MQVREERRAEGGETRGREGRGGPTGRSKFSLRQRTGQWWVPSTKSLKLLAPSRALLSQGLFHLGVFLEGTVGEGLRGATPRPQGMNSGAVTVLALGSGAGPGPAVEIRVFPYRCHRAAMALARLACWPPSPSRRVRPALVLGPLLGRLDLGCGVFHGSP